MFAGCSVFNQDISVLNTSNVTNMSYMFSGCSMFDNNGSNNINELITGKLTNASYMFESCFKFNRYIGNWNMSEVETWKECSTGQKYTINP